MSSKNKGGLQLIWLILLIADQTAMMILPAKRDGVFWMNWGFSVIAFLATGWVLLNTVMKKRNDGFLSLPSMLVVGVYLLGQCAIGLLLSWFPVHNMRFAFFVQGGLLIAAALLFVMLQMSAHSAQNEDRAIRFAVYNKRSLESQVQAILDSTDDAEDPALKKALNRLWEAIHYSDPMSSPQLERLDAEIAKQVDALSELDDDQLPAAIRSLLLVIKERDRQCQMLKQ